MLTGYPEEWATSDCGVVCFLLVHSTVWYVDLVNCIDSSVLCRRVCIVSASDPFFDLVGLGPAAASHLAAKVRSRSFLCTKSQTVAAASQVAANTARQLHTMWYSVFRDSVAHVPKSLRARSSVLDMCVINKKVFEWSPGSPPWDLIGWIWQRHGILRLVVLGVDLALALYPCLV